MVIWIILAMVVGFVGAGVLVLYTELSADTDDARPPGAWEVAWSYVTAFDERDAKAAAEQTDDPKAARTTLRRTFKKLPEATVSTALGSVAADGGEASGEIDVVWTFADGRTFSYRTEIPMVRHNGGWAVDFSPAVVHPELAEGQYLAVVDRTRVPAVVDANGKPLVEWGKNNWPKAAKGGRAKVLLPAMLTRAQERDVPERWAVAAMTDRKGKKGKKGKPKRAGYLSGDGPKGGKPLSITLSVPIQDAAQAAVNAQRKPAGIVAIEPSTGGLLAVAQNKAAEGPIALSGLYHPGDVFSLVTTAADGTSSKALVQAANSLGLNADFDIRQLRTEAGAVRKAENELQLSELREGQGTAAASPFGYALVASTIASGKAVTPRLWADKKTKVLKGYQPPDEQTITALRAQMRSAVTDGPASALSDRGEVYGAAGTGKGTGGDRDSWFAGYADDVAFAVIVADGGSAKPAVSAANRFLGGL